MTDMSELKHTPLYDAHVALKGRMVEYAGWAMPVLYTGILEEARAVRNAVGIFDISHMGRVRVFGEEATAFLQKLTSNDVGALKPSSAQYSLLMNPTGGIIDDIIVYREDRDSYLVVINAGNAEKDLKWMRKHVPDGVTIQDQSEQTAMIAVQGPKAPEMVAQLAGNPALLERKRFQYATGLLAGIPATFLPYRLYGRRWLRADCARQAGTGRLERAYGCRSDSLWIGGARRPAHRSRVSSLWA